MNKGIKEAVKQCVHFYGVMLIVAVLYCFMLERYGIPFIRWVYRQF